ncbi:COX15/CtaA family protein [Viridibacterium curvum]|uniref:COX15/CtaA family protein n=1 Tax=Viridibacterium curvum TaxID=1101404 RepID=A0ABP9QYY8_9RHOO
MIRKLAFFSLLLALFVVVLGAYVRLSDAGLGCPDWPGCYGHLSPHHAKEKILAAHAADTDGPVSMPKAWKEMVHRYLASFLGLLILIVAWLSLRRWRREGVTAAAPLLLVGIVIFQGMLGMWTVTLLLKPAIVTLHLLGGLAVLGTLTWIWMRESGVARHAAGFSLSLLARGALLLLVLQIALGGWVSTNYAALACPDFPTCQNSWLPGMDFENAFHVFRELGRTAEGEILPAAAMTAIHWAHRVGAIIVGAYLLMFAWRLMRYEELRGLALGLAFAVLLQISLGISNVVFSLPLAIAVAHNAVAALLVMLLVGINFRLRGVRAGAHMERIWNERLAA